MGKIIERVRARENLAMERYWDRVLAEAKQSEFRMFCKTTLAAFDELGKESPKPDEVKPHRFWFAWPW